MIARPARDFATITAVPRTTITHSDGSGIEGRETLRRRHAARLVEPHEEGTTTR